MSTREQLYPGDLLDDRYRIEAPIAAGGMSTVYRCVDLRLGRHVAAKVMHADYADNPVFRSRFRREARSMARLSHPNLVNVYDSVMGEQDSGEPVFLVMELITGGTLRELLDERGPMPPHAAMSVMRSVLTGLAVAHEAGMVHRDIKPDNILINGDHTVKLADFGLVRAADHAATEIIGTVSYLSPEQVEGADIGPASDVYSAGIVLYELLTGGIPFDEGDPTDRAFARLSEDVPAPSGQIAGVPTLIDALVATATARDVSNRFSDAGEFLAAINDVAEELQLPAFNVPIPEHAAAHRAFEQAENTDLLTGVLNNTGVLPAVPAAPVHAPKPTDTQVWERPLVAPPPPAHYEQDQQDAPVDTYDEQYEQQNYAPGKPVSNRSGWKIALWSGLITALIAAVALGGWWFGSGRYGEVPQIIGMGQAQAVTTIEQAGFTATTSQEYSDDIPAEQIIGTQPPGGERIPKGSNVAIRQSLGQPAVPEIPASGSVQDFRGLASERTLGLRVGEEEYSDSVPAGQISSTQPSPGTVVATHSTVTVHLSKGPAPIKVPKLAGLSQDKARDALEKAGLTVRKVIPEFDQKIKKDHVIRTSPDSNAELRRGDEVDLYVSTALEVPDLKDKTLDEARRILGDAGLTVGTVTTDEEATSRNGQAVVKTAPAAGKLIDPEFNTVDLVMNGKVIVPSLMGKKVSEAESTLLDMGLNVDIDGKDNAVVYSQSPKAGSKVAVGTTVTIKSIG